MAVILVGFLGAMNFEETGKHPAPPQPTREAAGEREAHCQEAQQLSKRILSGFIKIGASLDSNPFFRYRQISIFMRKVLAEVLQAALVMRWVEFFFSIHYWQMLFEAGYLSRWPMLCVSMTYLNGMIF